MWNLAEELSIDLQTCYLCVVSRTNKYFACYLCFTQFCAKSSSYLLRSRCYRCRVSIGSKMTDSSMNFTACFPFCSHVTTVKVFVCLTLNSKPPAGHHFDRKMLSLNRQSSLLPRLANTSKLEKTVTGPISLNYVVVFINMKCKRMKMPVE